jgi:transcriptional regulator with XRE-family HTH domain
MKSTAPVSVSPKETARVALGKLLTKLRKDSKVSKMSELSEKSGVNNPNIVHKIEGGRGEYPEQTIRALLPHLSAIDDGKMAEIEGYLRVIYPPVAKRGSVVPATARLVPAYA